VPIEAKMDHFGLFTNDLEKTIAWYNQFLGFKVSDYLPPGNEKEALVAPDGISWMRYSELHHDLTLVQLPSEMKILNSNKTKSNLHKISFKIYSENNFQISYKNLQNQNLVFAEKLFMHPFFQCPGFIISDPDGNLIEILNSPKKKDEEFAIDNNKSAYAPIDALSHLSINSEDINTAANWYKDVFGMQKQKDFVDSTGSNRKNALSDAQGEIKLILCECSRKEKISDLQQIAFRVKDNDTVLSIHDFISSKDIPIIREPFRGWTGWLRYYFEDIDKNKIEIESGMDLVDPVHGFENTIVKKLNLQHA
tara:strand:+ start:22049 stop:22972 length:924 start_codon:yes stop_codon:yes gene_type:complete